MIYSISLRALPSDSFAVQSQGNGTGEPLSGGGEAGNRRPEQVKDE